MIKDFFEFLFDGMSDLWQEWWGKVILLLLLLMIVGLPIWLYYDYINMVTQHCVQTGKTEDGIVMQYIYGANGQIVGSIPVSVTYFEYKCDDGIRWR